MDTFLLICLIVVSLLLIFVNVYLLALYVHPEDRGFGTTLFPKVLVVVGLTFSWGQVLMVPLDIANARGYGGGLSMDSFWVVAISLSALLLFFLIPFALYFYETDEQKAFRQRFGTAATYTVGVAIFYGIIVLIAFFSMRTIHLPVASKVLDVTANTLPSSSIEFDESELTKVQTSAKELQIKAGFSVFLMAVFSLVGWFLLTFFGGMGFFAIPMDLINSYRNRPLKRSKNEILVKKGSLQESITDLIQMGQEIEESQKEVESARGFFAKRSAQAKVNGNINKFKATVLTVEQDFDIFAAEVDYANTDLMKYTSHLWQGVALLIVSLVFWIHILFYVIRDKDGNAFSSFLSKILLFIEETLGIGFLSYGIFTSFALFLVFSVTKGNVKFGLRIPFFFTIHPMKESETLMNSFLFNVWLLLTASVGMVHLLVNTFHQYTRLTSSVFLFGIQLNNMHFFHFFFANRIFETIFLVWSFLSLLGLCFCGKSRPQVKKTALLNK